MILGDVSSLESVNPITLIGVVVTLAGVVAWVLKSALPALLKQYRDDVFQLNADRKAEVAALTEAFRTELREANARHERELGKRDAVLEKITEAIDHLTAQISEMKHDRGVP